MGNINSRLKAAHDLIADDPPEELYSKQAQDLWIARYHEDVSKLLSDYQQLEKERDELNNFKPTADAIKNLPEPLREYIHDLATKCDLAGDVQRIAFLKDTVDALRKQLAAYEAVGSVELLQKFIDAYDKWAQSDELCGGGLFDDMVMARDKLEGSAQQPAGGDNRYKPNNPIHPEPEDMP